ncbi:MAG: hypothetical protein WCE64_15670 [Bacteroidales bacterium]
MATTTIRESTISRATGYLNQIRQLVGKNQTIPVSEMKKEATKMHVGTTYIDQAIALGYFKKNDKGIWKVSLSDSADFTPAHARAMVEKSNEYNRRLMRARARKAAELKVQKKATAAPGLVKTAAVSPAKSAAAKPAKVAVTKRVRSRRVKATEITDKYIERYLTDKLILDQFMKKHLISNLEVCALTSELHRRGLIGTLSGSIQV